MIYESSFVSTNSFALTNPNFLQRIYINSVRLFTWQSEPLTTHETERLIHEASQKERSVLENAVEKNLLSKDNPVLSQITARFSVDLSGKNDLKILL